MRHAEDPLLTADRIVRHGLGVRDGQTIRDRAMEVVHAWHVEDAQLAAARAILHEEGWPGISRAATILT